MFWLKFCHGEIGLPFNIHGEPCVNIVDKTDRKAPLCHPLPFCCSYFPILTDMTWENIKKIRWYTTSMTPAPLREAIKTSGQERRGESCCSQKFRTLGHFHFYTFSSSLLSCRTLLFLLKYVTKWKIEKGGDDRRVSVPRVILWNVQFVGSFLVKLCYTHTLIDIKMFTIVHYNHFSFAVFSHQSVLERLAIHC